MSAEKYSWLWDVEMSAEQFRLALAGKAEGSAYDQRWALIRLLDYAPYHDILRLLPRQAFVTLWPQIAGHLRSATRREGMAFVRERLLARSEAA
jgi:hypothetical protein